MDQEPPELSPEQLMPPPIEETKSVVEFLEKEVLQTIERLCLEKPIFQDTREIIREKVPKKYLYHKDHMINLHTGVMHDMLLFALYDRYYSKQFVETKGDHFLELIAIAAQTHDLGYTQGSTNHETRSAEKAQELMEKHNYPPDDIEKISRAISDTQMVFTDKGPEIPAEPTNTISRFLMDADSSNFGRTDNELMSGLVAEETGQDPNSPQFLQSTINLLETHSWKTNAAEALRQEQKEVNIRRLEEQIEAVT